MHQSRQSRLALLITILLLATFAVAQAGDTYFQKAGDFVEGVRCGTKTPTFEETQRVQNEIDAWLRAGGRVSDKAVVNIPVAVHVVAHDDGYADVSDASIAAQMDVLNAAYQGTGFAFTLVSTDRTYNTKWSTHRYGSRTMMLMKEALAIDPATTYNLYFCDIGGGLLGYATFPDMYPEDSYLHGVVCLWASVPGGAAAPYDEGDTATHETGHFLGLYHTFQGGCPLPNDYCDDTAPEATAAFGCPIGLDTCTGGDVDPIHNFMDYTDDDCMDHFTADQTTRMNQQMALYRPTMYGGTAPTGPSAAFSGTPTSGDVPLTVAFADASTGSPTSWSWTFGDGGTSTAQNPSHTYTAAGTYTVALTVANADGSDTLTRNGYISVTEPGTGGGGLHVAAISVYRVQSGRKYYGRADITIVDDGGAPVSGATVTAVYTGPLSGTSSGVTGTDGQVTLSSSAKTADATQFCFEVTGVTHADLDYDAAANVVTMACESGDLYRDGQPVAPVLALRNHPNPFNPLTTIEFELQRASAVTMRIFDAQGQVVATLVDGPKSSGVHRVTWDARDQASGIYFYQVQAGDVSETRKMVLLK